MKRGGSDYMRVQLIRYHDLDNTNTRLAESLNKKQGVLPPLGLAYLASSLEKAGHEVNIIDAIALALSKEEVNNRIKKFNPKVVGVTAMTPTILGAFEAAKLAKENGALTVIGGVHMSILPLETLQQDFVDFGIVGEAEESLVGLCNALENNESYENITALCYKKDGRIVVGQPEFINDVDSLPMPAFHLLPMEKYSSIIGLHPTSTMMGSRGCPYLCGFCYKTPSDKKYRTRSVEKIVDEMEYLIENHGLKEIMFYDDLMPQKYAKELSEEIISRNVKIRWQTPQRVNLVNPELLKLMAKAGCRVLRFGVEQGDPDQMAFVEKRIDMNLVKSAFRDAKKAGIDTFAYFIIGYVNETEKTMQATIDLAKEIDPKYVMFTKAVPLPSTPLMTQAVEQNLMDPQYWSKFTLGQKVAPIEPLVPDAEKWVRKAYRDFYLRPSKIFSQLLGIKSLDDLTKSVHALVGLLNFKMNENAFTVIKKSYYEREKQGAEEFPNYVDPLVKINERRYSKMGNQLDEFELKNKN